MILGTRLTQHHYIILWLLAQNLMILKTKRRKGFSIPLGRLIPLSLIVLLQGFLLWIKISWILTLNKIRKISVKGMKTLSNLQLLKRIKMLINSIRYLLLLVGIVLRRSTGEIRRLLLDWLIKVAFRLQTENLILCRFKLKQNLLVNKINEPI